MRAQSLLLGRVPSISTSASHPSPKKQPTLPSYLTNVISVLSHFHPAPSPHTPPPARQPAHSAFGSMSTASGFFLFFSMRSRCAQDSLIIRWGSGGRLGEVWSGRLKIGKRCAICLSLSAAVNMVTSAGWRGGD